MTNKPQDSAQPPTDAATLRKRAEEKAQHIEPTAVVAQTPEEIQQMVHELRVHQIELEMQNEELRTAQELINAERVRYFDLYDLAPVGYCTVNEKGLILQANLTAVRLLGTARSALLKQPISRFILKEDQNIYYLHRKQLLETGTSQEYDLRLAKPDGTFFWAQFKSTAALADDGTPVCRVTFSDITERKQAEVALEQKNQELEQFVYSVSHDLKSPLVTVRTYAGMLRQDLLNADQPQINEDLNYIDKAADKMQMLLDALLQYSRIGRIDTPAQTVSVDQQVQNCLAALAGILQQHEVQVSTGDLPHHLHGNPLHFGQIWQNLIENAIKYRGDQPQPHIEIGATQEGQDVVFYVRDNGMGIAPEHNERIFNLFSQLNPNSDGSGLGLALVKKVVTIYGGRIWVESDGAGRGSCFMFTLPGALVKEDTAI